MLGAVFAVLHQVLVLATKFVFCGIDVDLLPGMDVMHPVGALWPRRPGLAPLAVAVHALVPTAHVRLEHDRLERTGFAGVEVRKMDGGKFDVHLVATDLVSLRDLPKIVDLGGTKPGLELEAPAHHHPPGVIVAAGIEALLAAVGQDEHACGRGCKIDRMIDAVISLVALKAWKQRRLVGAAVAPGPSFEEVFRLGRGNIAEAGPAYAFDDKLGAILHPAAKRQAVLGQLDRAGKGDVVFAAELAADPVPCEAQAAVGPNINLRRRLLLAKHRVVAPPLQRHEHAKGKPQFGPAGNLPISLLALERQQRSRRTIELSNQCFIFQDKFIAHVGLFRQD
jgi:hypothetical protein